MLSAASFPTDNDVDAGTWRLGSQPLHASKVFHCEGSGSFEAQHQQVAVLSIDRKFRVHGKGSIWKTCCLESRAFCCTPLHCFFWNLPLVAGPLKPSRSRGTGCPRARKSWTASAAQLSNILTYCNSLYIYIYIHVYRYRLWLISLVTLAFSYWYINSTRPRARKSWTASAARAPGCAARSAAKICPCTPIV